MSNISILFFGSSHKIGLTSLLTKQAIHIKNASTRGAIHVISGEKEQFTGLFNELQNSNISHTILTGLDDHNNIYILSKKISKLIDTTKPSVVHCQTNWQLLLTVFSKLNTKHHFKVIYTIHGFRHNSRWKSKLAKPLITVMLAIFADTIIACSNIVYDEFNILGRKLTILPIGVDDIFFNSTVHARIPKPPFTFIFPAEFRKGKNHDWIVRSFGKYYKNTSANNFRLSLPGVGKELHSIKKLCNKHNISHLVDFPGLLSRKNLLSEYNKSDCAIIPSNYETFGQAISEPFVLGLAILTRPVGVARDIIINRRNGLFFNTEDELYKIICYTLNNPEEIIDLGRNNLEDRNILSWEAITSRYFDILNNFN